MTIDELLALTGLTGSDEIPVWDAEASGEPTKKITAQNFAAAIKTLASLLGTGDVVNNLTSMATDAPASAALVNGRFKTVSSGSLHDIKTSGVYYLTGGVSDKPATNGGQYIVSAFSNSLLVGFYTSTDGYSFSVIYINDTWYTYHITPYAAAVSGTTSSSGAIELPSFARSDRFLNALLTTGGPGYVVRRDVGYFTVFNNSGQQMVNTEVAFDAYFI